MILKNNLSEQRKQFRVIPMSSRLWIFEFPYGGFQKSKSNRLLVLFRACDMMEPFRKNPDILGMLRMQRRKIVLRLALVILPELR